MIIGFVYFRSNLNWNTINHFVIHRKNEIKRHYKDKKNEKREALKLKVDAVLDKINEKGYDSLSKSEREFFLQPARSFLRKKTRTDQAGVPFSGKEHHSAQPAAPQL